MADIEGVEPPPKLAEANKRTAFPFRFPSAADELAAAKAIAALGDHIVQHAQQHKKDAGGRNATAQVCAGDAADEMLDVAEAENADVLVLGRRGLGHVREILLGSVSQKVLHHADCTVAIVH